MSETVTLYRKQIREVTAITPTRPASSFVSHIPVGDFRRVQWCRTHDGPMSGVCDPELPACDPVEVWQEVTP